MVNEISLADMTVLSVAVHRGGYMGKAELFRRPAPTMESADGSVAVVASCIAKARVVPAIRDNIAILGGAPCQK